MAAGGTSSSSAAPCDALLPPKDDPDLEPEMRHYDVSPEPIGAGGFGTVRKGLHLGSNTRIAMKNLPVGERYFDISDEKSKAVRKEEENVLKLCHHVNVVRCFDAFQTKDNDLAISMEYCDLDLEKFMKVKSNRRASALINVAFQAASGLES